MGAARHGTHRLDRGIRLLRRRGAAARALQHAAQRRRQALVHGDSEPGGGGAHRRHGVGVLRPGNLRTRGALARRGRDGVRGHHHGLEREVLQRQGHQPSPADAFLGGDRHRPRAASHLHPAIARALGHRARLRRLGLCLVGGAALAHRGEPEAVRVGT